MLRDDTGKTSALRLYKAVSSREDALDIYQNTVDCRINGFGTAQKRPSILYFDLDKLDKELVLFTGNDYHIYQPIDCPILEELPIFAPYENVTNRFLKFAVQYLSRSHVDKGHMPHLFIKYAQNT
jgi:hypothetical protein